MKKMDISRLERLRKINLKIGYVVALALMIAAFSWTVDRPVIIDNYEEPTADVLVVPSTYQEPKVELPKLAEVTKKVDPKNRIIVPLKNPDLLPTTLVPSKPEPPVNKAFLVGPPIVPKKTPPPPKPPVSNEPFFIVEQMPLFGDCDDDMISKEEKKKCSDRALLTFLKQHLNYPAIARENGVEGMVVIRFVVEKNGEISGAKIMRDIGAGCGQEALRVVNKMPEWVPGRQRGHEVRVQYTLPVQFKLQ
ncbi:MAG: TonB family protein [Bacteroidota bacterium]